MSELFELPNGWEWCSIKSIVVETKSRNPTDLDTKTFTYVDIGSVNNEKFTIEEPKIINVEDAPSRARKEIRLNDVVYSTTRPNLKNIAIVTKEYENPIASTGFCVLRVTDKSNNRYLFYYLLTKTYYDQIEGKIRGAQYPAVSDSDVKNSLIPLPPLTEQQRIVEKLDKLFEKIDKAIALHQKNIDEANAFMGSALNEVFGELEERYGLIPIDDVVVKTANRNPMDSSEAEFTYIDISSIDNENFKIVDPKILIGKDAPSRARKEVIPGDVLYSTTRPNLKNIAIVRDVYTNPIASTGFCVLRVNSKATNGYLFYFLITNRLYEQIEPNIRGAQYPATSDKDLKSCVIANAPLSIQQKVVAYLDDLSEKIERVKTVQKDKMDSLKALKASILDKAFRGEL